MRIIAFRARFHGLYEWGKGWLSQEQADAWHEYLAGVSKEDWVFWSHHKTGDAEYLVSVTGSIYMHPMGITYISHRTGMTTHWENGVQVETFPDIDSLKELLADLADTCGGTVEFSEISECEMKLPDYPEKGE